MSENTPVSEVSIKEGDNAGKGGRPPHETTDDKRNKVKSCAAVGIPQEDIARLLGICLNTLRKHYIDELDTGSIEANATIGGKLYTKAKEGDTACLIWWTKARMGWSDKTAIDFNDVSDHMLERLSKAEDAVVAKYGSYEAEEAPTE